MLGIEGASAGAQCRQRQGRAVLVIVYPFGQAQLVSQIILAQTVAVDKATMSPQIQQQLITPLQRERTSISSTAAAVCKGG